jgi:replicative DNA helicase
LDDVGGAAYLIELARNTPSAANIKTYADIVRQRSVLRQLITIAHEIAETAHHPQGREITELLDEAERKVFKIANQSARGSGPQTITHVLTTTVEKIERLCQSDSALTGLSTGYYDFDEATSGLQNADLIIVAGRPSMGKTTFAMNMVENAAMCYKNKPVLVFSMEMPADSLAMRMLASLGRVEQTKIRSGKLDEDDWTRFGATVAQLSETKILIDDTPALSPTEVRSRARRVVREHGDIALIVIDYLQLMSIKGASENRTNEISEISRSLKALAKELNVPVIALSQLNRELEKRPNKRPVMSDLRESGAIEQDADLIVFVYRDEVYYDDSPDKGVAEIIIGKQRNGPIGTVRLRFEGRYSRFDNLAPDFYQE